MGLFLRYAQPAELTDQGWEEDSILVGNGYLGANIFGGISDERIQITENSMFKHNINNPRSRERGLTNFAELCLQFPHMSATEYERGLCLDNALAYTQYRL